MLRSVLLGGLGAVAGTCVAFAHITLETQQAPVGSGYKAVMRVPHGCNGSATTAIRVRIPEGLLGVKPMPKTGWKLDVTTGKYSKTYLLRGAKVNEGVTEVSWSGGNLSNQYYDEFVFTGVISDDLGPGQSVYFPVVQECEKGTERWIDIPAPGSGDQSNSSTPAPSLKLLPKAQ